MFTPEHGATPRFTPFTPSGRQFLSRPARTPRSVPKSDAKLRRVLKETDFHRLERLEWSIPVQIQEALLQSLDTATSVSCRCCEAGFLCVVAASKLLLWHLEEAETTTGCLVLPLTDGKTTAELVDVSVSGSAVNVLVASPTGLIHYIANANHTHHGTATVQLPLVDNQLITRVSTGKRSDFYVNTSDGAIYVISCSSHGHQSGLDYRQLQQSQSILAGIGRRFSSLLFGGGVAQEQQYGGSVLCLSTILCPECELLYVLTDRTIELWEISDSGDKLACQTSASVAIQDGVRLMPDSQLSEVTQLYPLSILAFNAGVFLLAAYSTQSHIAYMLIELNDTLTVQSAVSAHCRQKYSPAEMSDLLSYKLVGLSENEVVSYNQHTIWSQLDSSPLIDRLQIGISDNILAAGASGDQFVLLSQVHGMLAVVEKPQPELYVTTDHGHTQPLSPAKRKKSVESTGNLGEQLRSIFVRHCHSEENMDECLMMSNELLASLPLDVISSELDHAVFDLSLQLINDSPNSDPRWAEHNASDLLASSSVIILDSLQSKLQAHSILVQFLCDMGFISRLGMVRVDERQLATVFALCEHQEKLLAAISLRKQHTLNPLVIDSAIRRSVYLQAETTHSGLTAIDLFYKDVSSVEDIIGSLVNEEECLLTPDCSNEESLEIVESVNRTLESMLSSAIQHRQAQSHVLGVDSLSQQLASHLNAESYCWTDTDGAGGVRTLLMKHLNLVVDKADALPNGIQLLQSLTGLIDVFLNTFALQLDMQSTLGFQDSATEETRQRFAQCRSMAIKPFVVHGLSEIAAVLSERYHDFATLIQLCESDGDEERLKTYAEQFDAEGFVQFLFKYYMDQGELGKLLCQPSSRHVALTEFLKMHPHLSWLHHIATRSFREAHEVLTDLAVNESEELRRKKTLLSLSKLSLLASDESNQEQEQELYRLNSELEIVLHQEQLPSDVLQAVDIDPEKQPPLTVEELIEFYTSPKVNPSANEYDFKKALDLVTYADEKEVDLDKLMLLIWCRAVLRDSWSELEGVEPAASIRRTIFFRIIEVAFNEGVDLFEFVPSIESLIGCDELKTSGLTDDKHFLYLLKMGYEQLELEQSHSSSQTAN